MGAKGAAVQQTVMAGISEALVATAVGLAVAIPAVVAFNVFNRQLKTLTARTNALGHALVAPAPRPRAASPVRAPWQPGRLASHGRRRAGRSDEEITGINVTPLVDIVLVLLIIFMVTANFIVRETVEVDLPRAANGGETVQGLVNVVLDKDGQALLRRRRGDARTSCRRKVVEALEKDKDTRAIISADQTLNYGTGDAPHRRGEGPGHRQVRAQHPEGRGARGCARGRA